MKKNSELPSFHGKHWDDQGNDLTPIAPKKHTHSDNVTREFPEVYYKNSLSQAYETTHKAQQEAARIRGAQARIKQLKDAHALKPKEGNDVPDHGPEPVNVHSQGEDFYDDLYHESDIGEEFDELEAVVQRQNTRAKKRRPAKPSIGIDKTEKSLH